MLDDATGTGGDLAEITPQTALHVFTTAGAIDPYLQRIRREVDAFVPDVTTEAGRKGISSLAYKVAQSKSALERVGKELADHQKDIPKKIDACRRRIKDTLDAWRDEVRQPLDAWEVVEDRRKDAHAQAIQRMSDLASPVDAHGQPRTAADLRTALASIQGVVIDGSCEEFEEAYGHARTQAISALETKIPERERHEADQAELIQLREDRARRQAADEAAERAKRAAAEQEAKAAREQAEAERREAEIERLAQEKAQRLKADAEAAVARIEAERQRQAADAEHQAVIVSGVGEALIRETGLSAKAVAKIIAAVRSGAIPNLVITY